MHLSAQEIRDILSGNEQKLGELIKTHQRMVFQVIFRVLQNQEESEEVTQDVFLRMYQSLASFKGTAKFSTWLYKMAYNAAISKVRIKSRTHFKNAKELEDCRHEIALSVSYSDLETTERNEILYRALDQLTAYDRSLISMFHLDELSIAEIAEILNLSPQNVKVRLFRTRNKLNLLLNTQLSNQAKELLIYE